MFYKKRSQLNSKIKDNITPPVQFRNQLVLNCEAFIHKITNAVPKAMMMYRLIQNMNIKVLLSCLGITNKWLILGILLII